jgi:hypothetical protein
MRRARVGASALTAGALLAGIAVLGVAAPAGAQAPRGEDAPLLEPAALEAVQRMARMLAGAEALRVEADVGFDAVQRDGQQIEFGATRKIEVRRPDRVRAEAVARDGVRRQLFYDGARITLFDASHNVYASVEQTGGIDVALDTLHDKLGVPTPLGELLSPDLERHLVQDLTSARVVGEETLDGVPVLHLALRNQAVGIQLWLEQGERPLPRRLVVSYEGATGVPQFRAAFSKWDLSPRLRDAAFVFEPPEGAERITFTPLLPAGVVKREGR